MTIPLTKVTVTLVDPSDNPQAGVEIKATLSSPIIYDQIIIPTTESQITNNNGYCELMLCPNNVAGSKNTYTFTIKSPELSRPLIFYDVTVPAQGPVTLHQLLGWGGPPDVSTFWTSTAYWTGTNYWM